MSKDIELKEQEYWCGYCKHTFSKTLTIDKTGLVPRIKNVNIICPKCGNYLKKEEDQIQ